MLDFLFGLLDFFTPPGGMSLRRWWATYALLAIISVGVVWAVIAADPWMRH